MQLVELQRNVHATQGDEVAVLALSYDPVSTLTTFAAKHEITYPLLADVGSKAITEIGLLNTGIEAERAYWGRTVEERHIGLPYPGTFILDEDGVVVERIFEASHRLRPGGSLLLDKMGIDTDATEVVSAEGPAVAAAAWVDTPEYFPNQLINLTVRIGVDPEYHVYVPPNPDGFTNVAISVDAPAGVFVHDHVLPAGHPFEMAGFDEVFTVAEGEFDVQIPFYVLEDTGHVTLPVRVDYQACSDDTCLVPDSVEVMLELDEIRA